MFFPFVFFYLILCVIVGIFGNQRQIGFMLSFVLAIFFTPVLIAVLLALFGPKKTS